MKHYISTALFALCTNLVLHAQLDYGDGTQRLRSVQQHSWKAADNKYVPSDSWQYHYTGSGKEAGFTALGYSDVTKLWNPWFAKVMKYDGNGNMVLELDSHLNPGQFGYRTKKVNKYNGNNQITEQTIYTWNTTNSVWEPSKRNSYTYHSNGKTDSIISETYDKNTSAFKFYDKVWHIYNSKLELSERWTQLYNSTDSKWTDYVREYYTYTATGKSQTYQRQGMHFVTKEWTNDQRVEYDYNSEDKIVTLKGYKWNGSTKVWNHSSRETWIYSANSYYKYSEVYDDVEAKWSGMWKDNYTLLSQGWPAEIIMSQWDKKVNNWVNRYKNGWDYNSHGYGVYRLAYTWDDSASKWKNGGKSWYYYDNITRTVNPDFNHAIRMYPNPVNDVLIVEVPGIESNITIELFDYTGRRLFQMPVPAQHGLAQINFKNLGIAAGNYQCRIQYNNQDASHQIVVK